MNYFEFKDGCIIPFDKISRISETMTEHLGEDRDNGTYGTGRITCKYYHSYVFVYIGNNSPYQLIISNTEERVDLDRDDIRNSERRRTKTSNKEAEEFLKAYKEYLNNEKNN